MELVQKQGGDISYIENPEKFEKAKYIEDIKLEEEGYISNINAKEIGKIACSLGAGRIRKEDKIDNSVGITLFKKVGDKVEKGETIAKIHANDKEKLEEAKNKILEVIKITEEKQEKLKSILEVIK